MGSEPRGASLLSWVLQCAASSAWQTSRAAITLNPQSFSVSFCKAGDILPVEFQLFHHKGLAYNGGLQLRPALSFILLMWEVCCSAWLLSNSWNSFLHWCPLGIQLATFQRLGSDVLCESRRWCGNNKVLCSKNPIQCLDERCNPAFKRKHCRTLVIIALLNCRMEMNNTVCL